MMLRAQFIFFYDVTVNVITTEAEFTNVYARRIQCYIFEICVTLLIIFVFIITETGLYVAYACHKKNSVFAHVFKN